MHLAGLTWLVVPCSGDPPTSRLILFPDDKEDYCYELEQAALKMLKGYGSDLGDALRVYTNTFDAPPSGFTELRVVPIAFREYLLERIAYAAEYRREHGENLDKQTVLAPLRAILENMRCIPQPDRLAFSHALNELVRKRDVKLRNGNAEKLPGGSRPIITEPRSEIQLQLMDECHTFVSDNGLAEMPKADKQFFFNLIDEAVRQTAADKS
jgi:hypothetical protein